MKELKHIATGFQGVFNPNDQRSSDLMKGRIMIESENGIKFYAPTYSFKFLFPHEKLTMKEVINKLEDIFFNK